MVCEKGFHGQMCGKYQVKENQESLPKDFSGSFFNALRYVDYAVFGHRTLPLAESSQTLGFM